MVHEPVEVQVVDRSPEAAEAGDDEGPGGVPGGQKREDADQDGIRQGPDPVHSWLALGDTLCPGAPAGSVFAIKIAPLFHHPRGAARRTNRKGRSGLGER